VAERRTTWAGAIRSAADARDVLAAVNQRSLERSTTTALAEAVRPADDTELAPDASKLLPVDERLAGLLYLNNEDLSDMAQVAHGASGRLAPLSGWPVFFSVTLG
jgi:hypothetical protein